MAISDIINSVDKSLEKNISSYKKSNINTVIDAIKYIVGDVETVGKQINKIQNTRLQSLSKDTLFTVDRYEGDYAICENRSNAKNV